MIKNIMFILTAGVLGFASVQLFAQDWGPGYGHGWMHRGYGNGPGWMHHGYGYNNGAYGNIDFLRAELNLTDQQVEKITKIDTEFRSKFYKNRYESDELATLRKNHREEVKKVLTPEQRKIYDDLYRDAYRGNGRGYCCGW